MKRDVLFFQFFKRLPRDPAPDWVAVLIYPSRSLEQKYPQPSRCLLESDQLVRIYEFKPIATAVPGV